MLLETAGEAELWQKRDPLVWPGLCSFRHFVELTLKMLARDTPILIPGDVPTTHRLSVLWAPVREGFREVFPDDDRGDPVGVIEEALAVLEALDPTDCGTPPLARAPPRSHGTGTSIPKHC